MSVDMMAYLRQMLWSVLFGIGLGMLAILLGMKSLSNKEAEKMEKRKGKVYAFFHIEKRSKPQSKAKIKQFMRMMVDVLFGIVSGVFIAIFAYATNDGVLRWFSAFTLAVFFILTTKFFTYPIYFVAAMIWLIVKCLLLTVVLLLLKPLKKIAKWLLVLLAPIYRKTVLLFSLIRDKIRLSGYQNQKTKELQKFINRINKDIISWQKK